MLILSSKNNEAVAVGTGAVVKIGDKSGGIDKEG